MSRKVWETLNYIRQHVVYGLEIFILMTIAVSVLQLPLQGSVSTVNLYCMLAYILAH